MASRPGCERGCEAGASPKLWFALVLVLMVGSSQASRRFQEQQGAKEVRLQAYFDPGCDEARHAPPVKSFLVSDGSWVDCIPIEGQIAAHHPSLKDHVIQMTPSLVPQRPSESHPQAFAREYGGCPEGSIPVLRDDPSGRFMQKVAPPVVRRESGSVGVESVDPATDGYKHEYAIAEIPKVASSYSGTKSIFSVNGPTLGSSGDMSLSQIWVVDGAYEDKSLSTIEVGWQTLPQIHPNDNPNAPHLFIFWTNDAYNTTHLHGGSCYNLKCPGFVQKSNSWVIGGTMPHYTTLAQNAASSFEIAIQVLFKPSDRNWWLYLDGEAIGYWPTSIYVNGKMQGTCNQIQWGGEVAFTVATGQTTHSKTAMGSGAFPIAGWPKAAFHRNISYFNAKGASFYPKPTALYRRFDDPRCYDIQVQQGNFNNWGTYFFFGGPGGANSACHY